MEQQTLYAFVHTYLMAMDCQIITAEPTTIKASLSIQADKELLGRYYYWSFVERTGVPSETMTMIFIFDEQEQMERNEWNRQEKIEVIRFGCPLLQKMMDSACLNGRFVRLYEQPHTNIHSNDGLTPWLALFYKISYISDRKKDQLYPLGINLINGEVSAGFDHLLQHGTFTQKIPDYHYRVQPIFSIDSASQRVEEHILHMLEKQPTSWAEQAHARLDDELHMLEAYFANQNQANEYSVMNQRKQEVETYRPNIRVVPVNVALLYLRNHPLFYRKYQKESLGKNRLPGSFASV